MLYCTCQQPYDTERGMVECDSCEGWFHYECVGMEAPEDDDDVEGATYMCSGCCVKFNLPYAAEMTFPKVLQL